MRICSKSTKYSTIVDSVFFKKKIEKASANATAISFHENKKYAIEYQ